MINLKNLPSKPGVYFFKDRSGKVIYIGKALSLKARVSSHFKSPIVSSKNKRMIREINNIDFIETETEFQALLLEAKLIKQYQPKYNTRLKDNKRYLYIAILKKPHLYLKIVRRPELEKGLWDWFGPFPSSSATKQVLKIIRQVFPFCSCSHPHSSCLYAHLNLCPGPSRLKSNQYRQTINQIREVLNGKSQPLIKSLEEKMKKAVKKEDFEKANQIKKQIKALIDITQQGYFSLTQSLPQWHKIEREIRNLLIKNQKIAPITIQKIEGFDIANLGKEIIVGSMVVFINGEPEKSLYRRFNLKSKNSFEAINDPAAIHQIIRRRLTHQEWIYPQLILVDGGKSQVSAAFQAIKESGLTGQISLLGLAKKEEVLVIPQISQVRIEGWNLIKLESRLPMLHFFQQVRDEAHRFAQKYYRLKHQKTLFL